MNSDWENNPWDLSVDIETLATSPNAVILSVGLAWFRPAEPFETRTEHLIVNMHNQDREIDQETTNWWSRQTLEAQRACGLAHDPEYMERQYVSRPEDANLEIGRWMRERPTRYVWGWSATLDAVALSTVPFCPWHYKQIMCGRSALRLCELAGLPVTRTPAVRPHHADSDAEAQAHTIWKCLRALRLGKEAYQRESMEA